MKSLCKSCQHVREVVSGSGSTFLLCRLSQTDKRFPKYPPQPLVRCEGYQQSQDTPDFFQLQVEPATFAICRLEATAEVPSWAKGPICSITRTGDELSIVCTEQNVPPGIRCERDYRCLKVDGPLDFSLVGVIAQLTTTLAARNISLFVLSTFDTDCIFVKQDALEAAVLALTAAGHTIRA